MTHILRTLEDAERQRGEEVTSGQKTGGRSQGESGVASQKGAHFAELGNAILTEDTFVLEFGEHLAVFGTRMLRHQIDDGVEDGAPGLVLDVCVFDVRDGVTTVKMRLIYGMRTL